MEPTTEITDTTGATDGTSTSTTVTAESAITPKTTEITHEDQLSPAIAAPSTEAETHVLVPNDHVSFLHRLADDVENGVVGAEKRFASAFRSVFHRS
jgi:hypothetical protein